MSANPQTPTSVRASENPTAGAGNPESNTSVANVANGAHHYSRLTGTTARIIANIANTGSTPRGRIALNVTPTIETFEGSGVYTDVGAPASVYGSWGTAASYSNINLVIPGLIPGRSYRFRIVTPSQYESPAGSGSWFDGASSPYYTVYYHTNRRPNVPVLLAPANNSQVILPASPGTPTDYVPFTWTPSDPDEGDSILLVELSWRQAAVGTGPPGPWVSHVRNTTEGLSQYIGGTGVHGWRFIFEQWQSNSYIEWRSRICDRSGTTIVAGLIALRYPAGDARSWSEWSTVRRFFIPASTTPPLLLEPVGEVAVVVSQPTTLRWKFRDPNPAETQVKADVRYRVVGAPSWTTLTGDGTTPGTNKFWLIAAGTFLPGQHYEWQVRTDNGGNFSDWSQSSFFWGTPAPDSGNTVPPVELAEPAPPLGCGNSRVFVYDRGGLVRRGEITPIARLQWGRKRDDISGALLTTNEWGADCGDLLASLRCWMHEIVIFRDGVRVWEGPITRVGYEKDQVVIEAKDVMAYVYRRILRQGYNDAYRLVNGVQQGLTTVVQRATRIALNALGYDDPNVIQYISPINGVNDARQSRVVNDYAKTAWQEIDDLAATAGLDYAVSGRRIMFWDTHDSIGLLPEMSDGDFSEPPVVTEYGMQAATDFGVTNNAGVYGLASRPEGYQFYGHVEQLASAYGETEGAAVEEALTPEALAALQQTLQDQAERNIGNRYPTPLIVRIPDNATLNPDLNLGINQLVPGVHIPLRAVGTLRKVTQIQKLDSMTVTQDDKGEKITVILSPAPSGGTDEPGGGE